MSSVANQLSNLRVIGDCHDQIGSNGRGSSLIGIDSGEKGKSGTVNNGRISVLLRKIHLRREV